MVSKAADKIKQGQSRNFILVHINNYIVMYFK